MNFKEKLPQNAGNRISEVLDFKISRGRIPPDPPTSARFSASVNQNTGSAPDVMASCCWHNVCMTIKNYVVFDETYGITNKKNDLLFA